MMKKLHIRLGCALLAANLLPLAATSQDMGLGLYSYSAGIDASKWMTVTSTTNLITGTGDYAASGVKNIGFDFPFGAKTYRQFSVNSDGNMKLGSSATGTGSYSTPFGSGTANDNSPKINGMGCDGFLDGSRHYVHSQTFGDTLLVVEFCMGTYTQNSRNNLYKWQVQLYKSGQLTMVYCPTAPAAAPATSFQIGLCVNNGDGWIISSLHMATHFTNGSSTAWSSGNWPDPGRYYTFKPPVVTCPRPVNLRASNVRPSSFSYAWDDVSGSSQFRVELLQGEAVLSRRIVNGTTCDFTNLDPNTVYTVHVSAICGAGDTSFWNWGKVETPCNPILSLPYRYSFDDATASGSNGEISSCWMRHAEGTATRFPYPDNAQKHNGDYSLHLSSNASGVKSWVSLPEFSDPLQSLVVSFWAMRTAATGGQLRIGAIDYTYDEASYENIADVQVSANNVWEYFEVPLSGYTGSKRYLTFMADAAATNEVYIDEVYVGYPSSCTLPTAYSVTNVSATTATLNINHPTENRFVVIMHPVGIERYDTIDATLALPLSSLMPGTYYEGKIYTNCGIDSSASYLPFRFCTECSSQTLPVSFGAEGHWEGSASLPVYPCWNFSNANGSYGWRMPGTGSNAHGGDKSFYYYGTTSASTYTSLLMTPAINFTGNEEITCWVKTSSSTTSANYEGHFAVYATQPGYHDATTPSRYTKMAITGTAVDPTTYSVTFAGNTWQQLRLRLPDTLIGLHRLAFTTDRNSYTFYLDDIFIYSRSSCPAVDNVVVPREYIMGDSARVSWRDTNGSGNYVITYWPETATSSRDSLYAYSTSPSVTLTNLQYGMRYYVSVTSQCGNVGSAPSFPVSFLSECAPVAESELPYQENFEAYASGSSNYISHCWYKRYVTSSDTTMYNYPYPYNTAAIGGSAIGLYFYGASSSSAQSYAVMPAFETPYSHLMLEFDLKRYTSASSSNRSILYVGLMTDPTDLGTFTLIRSFDISSLSSSSVQHCVLSLEGAGGSGRIAFYAPNVSSNYVYLDNVTVQHLPACRWPVNVAIDSLAGTSVRLRWTGDATARYEMQASTNVTFSAGLVSGSCTGTTGSITGLRERTPYYVRVRRVCGADYSNWSDPISFETLRDCGPNMVNVVDTIGHGTQSSADYCFYARTSYPYGFSSSIFTTRELNAMGLDAHNRIHTIGLRVGSTGGIIRKARIYMREMDKNSFTAASDTVSRATMTLVYSGDISTTANSWVEVPLSTPFVYTGTNNLVITFVHDTTGSAQISFLYESGSSERTTYGYKTATATTYTVPSTARVSHRPNMAFDVCVNIPTCQRPRNLRVSGKTNTELSLAWDGTATSYQVLLTTAPVNPATMVGGTLRNASTNGLTISGLTTNTLYYYYVRSVCGNDTSLWSVEGVARTACDPYSVPYSEGFEGYTAGPSATISNCWVKGTNNLGTAYPYPNNSPVITGSRILNFQSTHTLTNSEYSYAALPMFNEPVNTLSLTFALRCGPTMDATNTTRLVVGVMGNPDDIATFEPYDTIDLRGQPALSRHGADIYFDRYSGSGRYIAIYCEAPPFVGANTSSACSTFVDDVSVTRIPTCDRPKEIEFSQIGSRSAMVKWVGNASQYEVEYGHSGFARGQGTTVSVAADSILLTMLDPATDYDVYVRGRCSNSDVSTWSYIKSFTTRCASVTLPLYIDPQSYSSTAIPRCWSRLRSNTADYPKVYNSSSYAYTGSYCIYYYVNSSNLWQTMVFPEIDVSATPVGSIRVSYWSKAQYNDRVSLQVGIMTDPTNDATFTPLATHPLTTTKTYYSDTLRGYTGNGSYVVIKMKSTSSSSSYAGVDDIAIEHISPCATVYNLASVGATATSADLVWTDTISSISWWIRYAEESSDNWVTVPAGTIPHTLVGLMPNTGYRFRVAPVCASGETSSWSAEECHFRTAQVPAAMPYSYNFENEAEWRYWGHVSSSNAAWARGTAASGNATHAGYLSLDGGATHSWDVQTRTNAIAYRDIDFGVTNNAYQIEFDASMGGATGNDNDGLSVMLVDPSQLVVPSSDPATTPWGRLEDLEAITLRRDTGWNHYYFPIDHASGVRRLVLYHYNQAQSGSSYIDYAPAIDNITVVPQPCARPLDLEVLNVTDRSALLSWSGETTSRYIIMHRLKGASEADNVYDTVVGTQGTIAGLTASTEYEYRVRRLCRLVAGDTLMSDWSRLDEFTTQCFVPRARDTIRESFETVEGAMYNVAGELPSCWIAYTTGRNAAPHVTDGRTYSYSVDGFHALTFTSTSNNNTNGTNYVAMPYTEEPTNKLSMTFWYCFEGSYGTLTVGYLTGDNFLNDFVPLKDITPTTAAIHIGNGRQTSRGLRDSISFSSVPAGNYRIAFRWSNTSTVARSISIDDITVWYGTICRTPTTVGAVDISYREAAVVATGTAPMFTLVYGRVPGQYTDTLYSETGRFELSGLLPRTDYYYAVRQDCDSTNSGNWKSGHFTTLELPCGAPSMYSAAGISYGGVSLSWRHHPTQTSWLVHVFAPGFDRYDTVSESPTITLSGLYAGTRYGAAVFPLCADGEEAYWSDTVWFTSLSCPQVSSIRTDYLGTQTAVVSWNAISSAMSYAVEYGYEGLYQGGGTSDVSIGNAAVLRGLEPGTTYDVYVRTRCNETTHSLWSQRYQLTTPTEGDAQTYYTVSVVSSSRNGGTVSGGGAVAAGGTTEISASSSSGYRFVQWSDGDINSRRTITVTRDTILTAAFARSGGSATFYTVRLRSNNGSWGHTIGSGEFVAGSTCAIKAVPAEGYHFVQWSDSVGGAVRFITVDADTTLTAIFALGGVGIDAAEGALPMALYPNPASHQVVVEVAGEAAVEVMDFSGRVLLRRQVADKALLDISHLAAGAYFVRAVGSNGTAVQKLIVTN